jgi:glucose-1-phosphate cytidylyltransferase
VRVVILAGGFGTRLAEETSVIPKPMVEIGGKPILWHIMKHYAHYGFREFCLALGYKGEIIKRHFLDSVRLENSVSISLGTGEIEVHDGMREDWVVHLVDTGLRTNTGGRVKHLEPWLHGSPFLLTYGDGVSNIDLAALVQFHKTRHPIATITAVRPPARFGALEFDPEGTVSRFSEKSQTDAGWINGGFMVFEPEVFEFIPGDETVLERDVLERLASTGSLAAYRHEGFWQCMDTLRDKRLLEALWQEGRAPWKVWD